MWRPSNWENPLIEIEQSAVISEALPSEIYEAGADAMLEALLENAIIWPNPDGRKLPSWIDPKKSGYFIFIPEES